MRRILLVISVAALMVAMMIASALPAFATHLGPLPHHEHFIVTPNKEMVEVGPDSCTKTETGTGFLKFHQNVHRGTPNLEAFQQPNGEDANPVEFAAQLC